jgi:methyl-accepting chemotaxis protein
MSTRQTQRALARYVNAATDLAEAVKHDIQHGGKILDATVLKLNEFAIAANAINDLTEEMNNRVRRYDN